MSDYIFDTLTENDSEEIINLINSIQPNIPWSAEHLKWQYFDSPAGKAKIYAAKENKKVIAMYVAAPKTLTFYDKKVTAFMIQDAMTDKKYRGQGLLHKLSSICFADLRDKKAVGYTFPNKLSENSFRRNNWSELSKVPLRILDNIEYRKHKLINLNKMENVVEEVCEEIWLNSGINIGVERSNQYLNWRYNKPDTNYEKYILSNKEGFLVLKFFEDNNEKILHICDLVVSKDSQRLIDDILKFCLNKAYEENCAKITAWFDEKHPYSQNLNNIGLKMISTHDRFIFIMNGLNSADLLSSSQWHISQGDSDVY